MSMIVQEESKRDMRLNLVNTWLKINTFWCLEEEEMTNQRQREPDGIYKYRNMERALSQEKKRKTVKQEEIKRDIP